MKKLSAIAAGLAVFLSTAALAETRLYVADHELKTLIKIKDDGTLLWSFPNNNGHDVQLLKNGNLLIVATNSPAGEVQEVSPDKQIIWKIGRPTIMSSEAAQRLPNGNTMIADNRRHCVVDINPAGEEVWHFDVPNSNNRPQPTMRQVRRLENGNTLICASTLDEVWEVSPEKKIVWKYAVPFPYLALRLDNGNTLISSGDGYGSPRGWFVVEVDKRGKTVWKYGGADAPADQQLRFPTGLVRTPEGNTWIAEAQNASIKLVSPDKKILKLITSPAMKHPCTIVVVDEPATPAAAPGAAPSIPTPH